MKRWAIIVAFAVFGILLSACGGQGPAPTPTPATTVTSVPLTTATVEEAIAEAPTALAAPTSTTVPVATPTPTASLAATPTPTQPPPAATVAPTLTPVPTPLPTPAPTLAPAPTPTPVPPSNTRINSARPSLLDYVDRPPPIASLITIGTPGVDGVTQVTGAAGSVPGSVNVMVTTLDYAQGEFVRAGSDGKFFASVIAAPGATIQVRYDPYDQGVGDPAMPFHQKNPWPGSLIRVSDDLSDTPGTPFSSAGSSGAAKGTVLWAAQGSVADRNVQAGDQVSISGTLRIFIPDGVNAPDSLNLQLHAGASLLFDSQGRQAPASSDFISRILTPTGLPIEMSIGSDDTNIGSIPVTLRKDAGVMVSEFNLDAPLSPNLPDGTYRLFLWIPGGPHLEPLADDSTQGPTPMLGYDGATAALITVGSPVTPKLSPMILVDSPSQGSRGVIPNEDLGLYDFSARVAFQSQEYLVQPRELGTGRPISYRLEPFFPFVSLADRDLPIPPMVPFDLPGGELSITVETPSGAIENLGSSPILQARSGLPATSGGSVLNNGGGNPGGVLQLTTLSDSYSYEFQEYGQYTISLAGSVPDIWGQDYAFDGTYLVWVAETLDLETASLPGTPFERGNTLPATVNIYPGIPADVDLSFELHPIDGSSPLTDSISGTANRYGYFDGGGAAFEMSVAGEYLITVRASYTDEDGRLWMGTRRWGSGIASAMPTLIAHGRRGEDSGQIDERLAWFSRAAIGVEPGPHHINFPYHSGDIVWATDNDSVQMRVTFQDTTGRIADLLEERHDGEVRNRRNTGDLPLHIGTGNGLAPTISIDDIDQWGYAYRAVERPGVRVREMVATELTKSPYWRFGDLYLAQRGMGIEGDRPNDLKWQFAATVFKQPDQNIGEIAIYGSLWVEIDKDDPVGSRVFPPFQGAAGGPTGGPIMTLKGEEIDLFLMPTAVRPGTVLEVGDLFVFAGQVGPPLASKVTVRATAPSGEVHTISGQANSVGYFSDPPSAFIVDEPGLWTVEVEVHHDGLTSAGPVEPPYPTGGVLGSADGRFQIYVVPPSSEPLDFGLPNLSFADIANRPGISFFPRVPESWTEVEGIYSISMPGFILEEGSLTQSGSTLKLVYDPVRLSREFPNIDISAWHQPQTGLSDEVFISVLLSGNDASGERQYAAKHLTLAGEDIYDKN